MTPGEDQEEEALVGFDEDQAFATHQGKAGCKESTTTGNRSSFVTFCVNSLTSDVLLGCFLSCSAIV